MCKERSATCLKVSNHQICFVDLSTLLWTQIRCCYKYKDDILIFKCYGLTLMGEVWEWEEWRDVLIILHCESNPSCQASGWELCETWQQWKETLLFLFKYMQEYILFLLLSYLTFPYCGIIYRDDASVAHSWKLMICVHVRVVPLQWRCSTSSAAMRNSCASCCS